MQLLRTIIMPLLQTINNLREMRNQIAFVLKSCVFCCCCFVVSLHVYSMYAKLPVCVTTQSLVPPPLTFLNYCSCTALLALYALHQTHAYSNSDASSAKLSAFTLSPILVLTSGTTSPKRSDTLLHSLPSKTNSRHFSSLSISTE